LAAAVGEAEAIAAAVAADSVEVADLAAATSEAAAQAEAGKVHCVSISLSSRFYVLASMLPLRCRRFYVLPDFSAAKRTQWPIFRSVRPPAKMPTRLSAISQKR
jgi:hypothetical protein